MAQDVQDMYAKGRLTRNKFALGGKKAAASGALGVLSVPAPDAAEDEAQAAEGGTRELPALTAQEQP
ncbi:hypothetical protein SBI_06654 [Streptomyces bingchenggensis BCW-1]|uniref:Uncharacterized protein n=2 Tax=Streptomyces TaxID=1883 RepID=D7BXM6_STRBB|nr:hypothetical protein SBI_06654 [Streptomyces bingchenggensis BCW-1]